MADTTPRKPGNPAGIPVSTRATMPAPAVRYVKRGKFRMPETLPDHQQATRALYDALPVHGLKAATVRELLHSMACALVSLEYRATHQPDRLVGDREMVPPGMPTTRPKRRRCCTRPVFMVMTSAWWVAPICR